MPGKPAIPGRPLWAAGAAGLAAACAQVLLIRELFALFSGNELAAGIVLAAWLALTAAGSAVSPRFFFRRAPAAVLGSVLAVAALSFPAAILVIRAARLLLAIPLGQAVPFGAMLAIVLAACAPLCLALGGLFAACWATAAGHDPQRPPVAVYLAEAGGAALGGLFTQFVAIPLLSPVTAAVVVGCVLLATALGCVAGTAGHRRSVAVLSLLGLAFVGLLPLSGAMERASRRLEWGNTCTGSADTPRNSLFVLKDQGQASYFADGDWLFTVPDPLTAALTAHPPLLLHKAPRRVLLIGGGVSGVLAEVLREPVAAVTCLEPDPGLLDLARDQTPQAMAALADPRVHTGTEDPAAFLRAAAPGAFDVILLALGEPRNTQANRFVTVEFFTAVARALDADGLFAFTAPPAGAAPGPAQLLLLKSLYASLVAVFPHVLVLPGDTSLFLARRDGAFPPPDTAMAAALAARGLSLPTISDFALPDMADPGRVAFITGLLAAPPVGAINTDFTPACAFRSLALWALAYHPALKDAFLGLRGVPFWLALVLTGGLGLVPLAAGLAGRLSRTAAVGVCVGLAGLAQMAVSLVLLFAYQIFYGFLYGRLALIVAGSMAGLALGAYLAGRAPGTRPERAFFRVQAGLTLALPVLAGILVLGHDRIITGAAMVSGDLLFPLLAMAAGALGGAHFALAARVVGPALGQAASGGRLYALDLAGAAIGALGIVLLVFPLYGVTGSLVLCTVLCLGGLAGLAAARSRPA